MLWSGMFIHSACLPTMACCAGSSMLICPAYLPTEACRAGSSMLICPASLPTEACRAGFGHVYSPCIPTYRGVSSQGLTCFVALCHTYKGLSCCGLVYLFTLRPYLHRPVAPGSGMFIHSACLHVPAKACCARVYHVYMPASLPGEACHASP